MYYGTYNNEGVYNGFYCDEFHVNIPEPNISLTTEEWQEALTGNYQVIDSKHTYVEKIITNEQLANEIRSVRNLLLIKSDWTQFTDSPLTEEKKTEWKVYRQTLRDLLVNCDLYNPVYPEIPR